MLLTTGTDHDHPHAYNGEHGLLARMRADIVAVTFMMITAVKVY